MEADKTQKLLKEKLKEKGLKVTHQRLLVLSVLEENSGSHMTAEDIYDLVSEDYPEIGLATVYRTLQLLWDMQLVDRILVVHGKLNSSWIQINLLNRLKNCTKILRLQKLQDWQPGFRCRSRICPTHSSLLQNAVAKFQCRKLRRTKQQPCLFLLSSIHIRDWIPKLSRQRLLNKM